MLFLLRSEVVPSPHITQNILHGWSMLYAGCFVALILSWLACFSARLMEERKQRRKNARNHTDVSMLCLLGEAWVREWGRGGGVG